MSMWSGISQIKQTLSDEFQQASGPKKQPADPISVIERNAKLMTAEPTNVDDIVSGLNDGDIKENISEGAEHTSSISKDQADTTVQESTTKDVASDEDKVVKESPAKKDQQSTVKEESERDQSPSEIPRSETPSGFRKSSPQTDGALNAKLAKFAKYESMYPRLLKAYKDEKKRYELVKLYEKVLSENTPCQSIAEPQALVDYLNDLKSKTSMQHSEIIRISGEYAAAKRESETTKADLSSTKKEVTKLRSELDHSVAELRKFNERKEKSDESVRVDSELKSKIELLESQLGAAEQSRDASVKSLTTARSQLDELHTRLKETLAESESLRDELHDSDRVSQERLQELTTLKSIARSREKDERASFDKADSQLSALTAEKELLESEVELLNKRVIRESEQLQLQIRSLRARLEESEAHEEELRKQLAASAESQSRQKLASQQQHDNDIQTRVPDYGDAALSDARNAAANAAKANELLKQVNKDHTLRIEKLQKSQKALTTDIEQLRHENSQLRRRATPAVSSSPTSETNEERVKQQAYLKNVLLGFIQHKDQRKALLPVLATLLDLKDSETDRFMNGFA